jgi:glutamine synthetase adenylyltransferase
MLADRVDHLLTGPDGSIAAPLMPLREAILATNNAQATLSNLGRSRAHHILAEIGAGRAPLTHATLDEHGPSRSIDHLRALLVAAHALPARDEYLIRLETFAGTIAASAHPEDRAIIALFARTHLLRRLRKHLNRSPLQSGTASRARAELARHQPFS